MKLLKLILVVVIFHMATNLMAQDRTGSFTVPDTINLYGRIPVVVDLLANDHIESSDSIIFVSCSFPHEAYGQIISVGVYQFTIREWGYPGNYDLNYRIKLATDDTIKILYGNIHYVIHDKSYDFLDINNVRAGFNAWGLHFFRDSAEYFIPKQSGISDFYRHALWIGGIDENKELHLAAQVDGGGDNLQGQHSQQDYFGGPVMDSSNYSIYWDYLWTRIWNLKKDEIEYHRSHWWEPDYKMKDDILSWPGNGLTNLGQAPILAPFADLNQNGIYEPMQGEYPEIRGDQCLYFIFNDDRVHQESRGRKLGIEVLCMAYAFNLPEDTAIKNTTFLNYRIFNRSQNTYDSTFIGFYTNMDAGNCIDDFLVTDVERNLLFCYNSDSIDGFTIGGYREHPPAVGVVLLSGPLMDKDFTDNPAFDNSGHQLCNYSVNGAGFSDNVSDNERFGLSYAFDGRQNLWWQQWSYFSSPEDYYNLLQGKWSQNDPWNYYNDTTNLPCRFIYPGLSDTANWGTGCIEPEIKQWDDSHAINPYKDASSVFSCGPFTFKPGDCQTVDLAFVWARDYNGGPLESAGKLRNVTDQIIHAFKTNQLSNGEQLIGMEENEIKAGNTFTISPNPSREMIMISFKSATIPDKLEILDYTGKMIRVINIDNNETAANVSDLPSGIYLVKGVITDEIIVKKLIISK